MDTGKSIIGWIVYIPAAFCTFVLVDTMVSFLLPYLAKIIILLNSGDIVYGGVETVILKLVLSSISGCLGGFVAGKLCPRKKTSTASIPITIVIALFNIISYIFYIYNITDFTTTTFIAAIVGGIAYLFAIIGCYITCEAIIEEYDEYY